MLGESYILYGSGHFIALGMIVIISIKEYRIRDEWAIDLGGYYLYVLRTNISS